MAKNTEYNEQIAAEIKEVQELAEALTTAKNDTHRLSALNALRPYLFSEEPALEKIAVEAIASIKPTPAVKRILAEYEGMTGRKIKPYKGGRTQRLYVRAAPEVKAYLESKKPETIADWIERKVKEEQNQK